MFFRIHDSKVDTEFFDIAGDKLLEEQVGISKDRSSLTVFLFAVVK